MWLLFHRNAKTRTLPDGESFVETCPECGKRATFREVELSESFGLFFVDIVGDKERAFRCGACGETFDLKDQDREVAAALPEPAPAKSAAQLARERAVLEREAAARATIDQQRRAELAERKANQIEDELAELKKRMGR